MRYAKSGVFLLGSVTAILVGCADTTGTNGAVPTRVTLSAAAPTMFQVTAVPGADGAAMALVSPDEVDSLMVTIERVEVLAIADTADTATAGDGQWIEVPTVAPTAIDLLALPSAEEDGVTLAAGDLDPGDYGSVRLFISSAQIWFNTEVSAPGNGSSFSADQPYDVIIPSSSQSGIKTDAGFTVPDTGGDIALTFDADATIQHVNLTGSGKIMVPPVIAIRNSN